MVYNEENLHNDSCAEWDAFLQVASAQNSEIKVTDPDPGDLSRSIPRMTFNGFGIYGMTCSGGDCAEWSENFGAVTLQGGAQLR